MENKDIPLTKKIDAIDTKLAEILGGKEEKKFNLPLGIRLGGRMKLKKNFCVVLLMRVNGEAVFKFVPIEDNYVKIDGTPYDVNADYMMRYKRYPLLVLPEWNLKPVIIGGEEKKVISPFDAKKDMSSAIEKGQLSTTAKTIIRIVEAEQVKQKSNISWTTILIIGGVLLVGYFIASSQGWI